VPQTRRRALDLHKKAGAEAERLYAAILRRGRTTRRLQYLAIRSTRAVRGPCSSPNRMRARGASPQILSIMGSS